MTIEDAFTSTDPSPITPRIPLSFAEILNQLVPYRRHNPQSPTTTATASLDQDSDEDIPLTTFGPPHSPYQKQRKSEYASFGPFI